MNILEMLFVAIAIFQVGYYFIYAFASLFPYQPVVDSSVTSFSKIKVFIPGYKEDKVILGTASEALNQSYPKEHYEVLIIADSFEQSTIKKLKEIGVNVLEVSFENSTKAKSLNEGLKFYDNSEADIAVILDSDNVMEFDFLEKINKAYLSGHNIIQGHRVAKNMQNTMSLLDAINEEVGNNIFRKGHRQLGGCSALIGSGMAFDFSYLKQIMFGITDIAGEDKMMEIIICKRGDKIEYLPNALVYDEKISDSKAFTKQRTRWIGAQFYFLRKYFFDGLFSLFRTGNLNYFDKVLQMALVPKILLLGALGICAVFGFFGFLSELWVMLFAIYCLALLLAVPRRFYNVSLIRAIIELPKVFVLLLYSVLRINKSTATKFDVTEKGKV